MGVTHVTAAVVNPADPSRRWEGLFLVDTVPIDCYVPASRLREIGIQPRGQRSYQLADGTERAMEVGVAQIEFMGEVVGATVIFGEEDAEPSWRDCAGVGRDRSRPPESAAQAVARRSAEGHTQAFRTGVSLPHCLS